jgi:hypothetical protein
MDNYKIKEEKKQDFLYGLKLRTAIIGAVLYLILSTKVSFKIMNLLFSVLINNFEVINEKNEPTFIAKLIMASIIAIILFLI